MSRANQKRAQSLLGIVIGIMIEREMIRWRAKGATEAEVKAFGNGFCAGMCANPLQAPDDVWEEAARQMKAKKARK